MPSFRVLLCAGVLLTMFPVKGLKAQNQAIPSGVPTIRVKSNLVFLDVTVLDKKGRPVVEGLTKEDFTILEDNKPQRIFSFEPPDVHVMGANPEEQNPEGKAPVTILVLDRLNSSIEEFTYICNRARKYLAQRPRQLQSPAELMVLGNRSLDLLQGYTRSRDDLMFAVNHLPAALPWKYEMGPVWNWDRAMQSLDALQEIALQNQGVPGRKNIIWVGYGGPGIWTPDLSGTTGIQLKRLVRGTVNALVDARLSLFVIYPSLEYRPEVAKHTLNDNLKDLPSRNLQDSIRTMTHLGMNIGPGNTDPFTDDVSFGQFANETGGKLFYNRNDVDHEIKQAQRMGAEYYTLSYQPPTGDEDGKFRHIRVILRNPKLRAMTKDGYYSTDKNAPVDPQLQLYSMIYQAAHAHVPYRALDVKVIGILRHPDVRAADLTVELKTRNIKWQASAGGMSTANVVLAGASLSGRRDVLAWKGKVVALTAKTQNPARLAASVTRLRLTLQVPRKTKDVRVVIVSEKGGQIGTADVDRKVFDAAPAAPEAPTHQ